MQQLTDAHKFPARKFPALQITDMHARSSTGCSTTPHTITRPEPPSLYDGSSPQHSKQQAAKFTRGPVHVSPCVTQRTQHNNRSSSCSKCETHNPASVFARKSQIPMSRRHSPTAMKLQRPTATIHRTRTNELVHTFPTIPSSVPSGRFCLFLAQTIPSLTQLNQRAQSQFLARTTGSETS